MAAAVIVAGALSASPASAASGPAVGECYRATDAQSYEDYWPDGLAPVSCSGTHTIQITRTHVLPADVNAPTFASDQCDSTSVWAEAGVNQPKAGIVSAPLRIESFYWVVRQPGAPASYVCAAGPLQFLGSKDPVLTSMAGTLPNISARESARLQFCASARAGRDFQAKPITVSCASTPRWQVAKWIMWDAFYDSYPGEAVLQRRARVLCGPGSHFSVPTASDWPGGTHRSWCYVKHT